MCLARYLFLVSVLATTWQQVVASEHLYKVWQQDIGGPLNLAPIVAHDLVYVVPEKGHLQVYDLHTGDLRWQFNPRVKIWERGLSMHGQQLLVCLQGGDIASLDALSGEQQWQVNLDGINCQRPAYDADGTLFVSTTFVGPGLPSKSLTGAKLFAIDAATGDIQWRHESKGYLLQTATSAGNTVYVGGSYIDPEFQEEEGGPAVYAALDMATGKLKWTHNSVYGLPKSLYANVDRLAYVAYEDFVVGLDNQTGEQIWEKDTENWVPAMIGNGRQLYFGSANTFVHAWDIKDGHVLWRYNVPGRSFEYLLVRPYLHRGVLHFMTQQGNVFAITASKGEYLWSAASGLISRIDPTFAKGYLVVGDINNQLTVLRLPQW